MLAREAAKALADVGTGTAAEAFIVGNSDDSFRSHSFPHSCIYVCIALVQLQHCHPQAKYVRRQRHAWSEQADECGIVWIQLRG